MGMPMDLTDITTTNLISNSKDPFWIKPGVPEIFLAPMEGVTDAPMREFFGRHGSVTRMVTEFFRISHEVPGPRVFRRFMPEIAFGCKNGEIPVHLQLLGGDPEKMALAAQVAVSEGAKAIDLNFGCPAPTVNRHDGGAALLKDSVRLNQIVRAVRQALAPEVPVSAKIRLGFYSIEELEKNAEAALSGGASWLTVHARTRMQGYAPPVFWKKIGALRKRYPASIIVANGDIWTFEDFLRCRDDTQCEHYMLGRGALANPRLVSQVAQELGIPSRSSYSELSAMDNNWEKQLSAYAAIAKPFSTKSGYALCRMKYWLKLAHSQGRVAWFDQIKTAQTEEGFFSILKGLHPSELVLEH